MRGWLKVGILSGLGGCEASGVCGASEVIQIREFRKDVGCSFGIGVWRVGLGFYWLGLNVGRCGLYFKFPRMWAIVGWRVSTMQSWRVNLLPYDFDSFLLVFRESMSIYAKLIHVLVFVFQELVGV